MGVAEAWEAGPDPPPGTESIFWAHLFLGAVWLRVLEFFLFISES